MKAEIKVENGEEDNCPLAGIFSIAIYVYS
jgi:hypothetical protein